VARAQLRWNAGTKNVRSTAQRDLVPLPTQTGGIAYADPADSTLTSTVAAYNYPGALVVSSRGAYDAQCFKDASAAGCTVLLYIDALVLNATGRYHSLLYNSSAYGAAVSQWGTYSANSTGVVADFRVGGILQSKLEAVLELAVAENPHIGGFFADDLGSRSWFPNMDWTTVPAQDQTDYRRGAIGLANTFRTVADRHGLMVMVNGTWTGGTLAANGGGYPAIGTHGCSLADGGFVEHHDTEIAFWTPYVTSSQWASASNCTRGTAFHMAVMSTSAGVTEFTAPQIFAYVALQTSANYDYPPTPAGLFHQTGLPSKVGR
jgi:hypothetical protein